MWRIFFCCLLLVTTTACQGNPVGKQFFRESFASKEGYESAVNRLEAYPLEEQWQIFLYANQVVHPPMKEMALPIAKQGKPALEYIFKRLEKPRHELDFRDSMIVFERMQQGGYYDVCGDEAAMSTIRRNESQISDEGWRGVYREILDDLCPGETKGSHRDSCIAK